MSEISSSTGEFLVFRVDTQASTYHAAIGIVRGRLLACLRSDSNGKVVREADGAPLVGEASLFETAPSDWVGKPLRIGAVVTSAVASVVAETDELTIRDLVATFMEPENKPSDVPPSTSRRPPGTLRSTAAATVAQRVVQHAEVAAWCLRRLQETEDGMTVALAEPEARARMKDALEDCAVLLRQLARRV